MNCKVVFGELYFINYCCKVNGFVFEGIAELCLSVTVGTFYPLIGGVEQAWDVHSLSNCSLSVYLSNKR